MNCKSLPAPRLRKTQVAFTLIELLVVITIIGVLTGIALPILAAMHRKADQVACMSNLRQVTVATMLAANDNNGSYPPLHGFGWEPGTVWIADCLNPYLGSIPNVSPAKVIHCPAAQKNPKEAWLQDQQYPGYKYNVKYAQNKKPLVTAANAMLYFDTTWPDWTQDDFAHSPGSGAYLHVAYADGHVATMNYKDYIAINSAGTDEWNGDFFELGWIK